LLSEFLLTELQKECLTALPQYIVQNHIQVVNHIGTFYHLNPDLVFDVNQIGATATSSQGVYLPLIGQSLQIYYSILEYNSYIRRNSVQAKNRRH
jgi:hypothetical protein